MLDRYHNFSVFNILELFEHLKLESVFILIFNFYSFKDGVIGKFVCKTHITIEFIFSKMITQKKLTDLELSWQQ